MPDFTTEINIEPHEFWDECSKREKQSFLEILYEDGYITKSQMDIQTGRANSLLDLEWLETVDKLTFLRLRITPEEQEIIESIVKKYT